MTVLTDEYLAKQLRATFDTANQLAQTLVERGYRVTAVERVIFDTRPSIRLGTGTSVVVNILRETVQAL